MNYIFWFLIFNFNFNYKLFHIDLNMKVFSTKLIQILMLETNKLQKRTNKTKMEVHKFGYPLNQIHTRIQILSSGCLVNHGYTGKAVYLFHPCEMNRNFCSGWNIKISPSIHNQTVEHLKYIQFYAKYVFPDQIWIKERKL